MGRRILATSFLLTSLVFARSDDSLHFGLPQWLNSLEGGYFNPKQEIRRVDPEDPTSMVGIFAVEQIETGELLNQVPWSAIISPSMEQLEEEEGEDGNAPDISCASVRALASQLELGTHSEFAPYVQYLLQQSRGQIPSDWSTLGQNLLLDVLGNNADQQTLPPNHAINWLNDYNEGCKFDLEDELYLRAFFLVVTRADDEIMVPIYDMYNHRNGAYYNTHLHIEPDVNHQVRARKTILPGEQIHNSYNMCDACEGRRDGYGTPEIMRDYGFVEDFPQRWKLDGGDLQFDLEESDGENVKLVWHQSNVDLSEPTESIAKLRKEVRRLNRIRNLYWNTERDVANTVLPSHEWDMIWQYHSAILDAISYVINDLVSSEEDKVPILRHNGNSRACTCDATTCGDHYDLLNFQVDDLPYNTPNCDNSELLMFADYTVVESKKTSYQVINFAERVEGNETDICMDLDDTLQICSSYRPHYHEYSAHYAARFLDEVRRVVFVGGGDSMLLDEVLKYPTLEKVVGLELDQEVTRKSFRYFHTQPHFDDDRVEWWFGDAIKSLLLLPKDYWQSFDLVLVDLSETVMAFTVTEDLEVFDALALLLTPDGVLVKNELYMEDMSKVFDYSVQIFYESPKICGQNMILGSNRADFLHRTMKDHGVKTLQLPPQEKIYDRFEYMHDYSVNDARAQGNCEVPHTNSTKSGSPQASVGILMVVDAEKTTLPMDEVSKSIVSIVEEHGLTTAGPVLTVDNVTIVVLKEGYIVARTWPEHHYTALDLNLWGRFELQEKLRASMVQALGSEQTSSFRVVVGGMLGSNTWEEDRELIGPQIVQQRNCESNVAGDDEDSVSDEVVTRIAVDEVVNLVHNIKLNVAVLCGVEDEDQCVALEVVGKQSNVAFVVPFWTCPGLEAEDELTKVSQMYLCEREITKRLEELLPYGVHLDAFVVDSSVPFEMGQVFNSIWSNDKYRHTWLAEHNLFVAVSSDADADPWQRNFLERYRRDVLTDPVSRAEIELLVGSSVVEVGIVTVGDEFIFHNLHTVETVISRRLSGEEGVSVAVRNVVGGMFEYSYDYNPEEFSLESYETAPAIGQFKDQLSLGRESVYQLTPKGENRAIPSSTTLNVALQKTVKKLKFKDAEFKTVEGMGEGTVVVATFSKGSVVLVWDGAGHVEINLFNLNDRQELADSFLSSFLFFSGKTLEVAQRDEFPRGTGRVVNFRSDKASV